MAQDEKSGGLKSLAGELPLDKLKDELQNGLGLLGEKAVSSIGDRITDLTDRLNDVADGGGVVGKAAKKGTEEAAKGGSPVKGALTGGLGGAKDKIKEKLGGGGGGGGKKGTKATNIIEEIDVGVPVSVAYNAWTEFQEWTGFMKKVEKADAEDDTKINFKAQVFWSHREWQGKILEQVPDEKIMWRSEGEKGRVDGAVTFHELAPNLTRILVVLEYYPQGLFERTGNLWRAQGRRARLELKHFRRHVMTEIIQNPDEVEGWRGEISEGEVERDHDEVVEEEQQNESEQPEDEYEESEGDEEEPADEYEDEESDEELEDEEPAEDEEEPADEYEDEESDEELEDEEPEGEEEPADEYEDEELEEEPADEYEDEELDEEEPEDEYEDEELAEDEESEEEPEAEYEDEDEEEEPEEKPARKPRRRRKAA